MTSGSWRGCAGGVSMSNGWWNHRCPDSGSWYSQAPAASGLLPVLVMIAAGGEIIACLLMAIPTECLHANSFALAIHVQLYSSGRLSSSRKMQTFLVRWVYSSYVRNEKLRNLSISDDALASFRWHLHVFWPLHKCYLQLEYELGWKRLCSICTHLSSI